MTTTYVSYQAFCAQYPDEDSLLRKIFEMRYSFTECPNCGHSKPYQKIKGRRGFQCSKRVCSKQIFPLAETVLKSTKKDIRTWVYVINWFVNSRTGLTATAISKLLIMTPKTALRMLTVIRMNLNNFKGLLDGAIIESDETLFGPKLGRLSNSRRKDIRKLCKEQGIKSPTGRSLINKTLIFGMVERGGRMIAKIVPDQKAKTLMPIIKEHIPKNSTLFTDESNAYSSASKDYIHGVCNHQRRAYVIKQESSDISISTNTIEGAWNLLKRTLRNYFSISKKFLPLYIEEFCFRYNNRRMPDFGFWNLFCNLIHPLVA